ncbi:MAG: penicillin-binding transpeptidase domain-containing protein [Anaerovoracaceae bacterium]
MAKPTINNRKRLVWAFLIFALILVCLTFRVGYIQIVKSDEYKALAVEQQKKDNLITAKRGRIQDRNGNELAISTTSYSIWITPSTVKTGLSKEEGAAKLNEIAEEVAKITGVKEKKLKKDINQKIDRIKLVKYLERTTVEKIRKAGLPGVYISSEERRFFPQQAFASSMLGVVADDNNGITGLELQYNNELKGVSGRWIKSTDAEGNPIFADTGKYYKPENGSDLVLTIDQVIQHYAEEAARKAIKETKAKEVQCVVMDPKTGGILAMTNYPTFDPNSPRIPMDKKDRVAFERLSEKKKNDYINNMWRNTVVSDVYEPGSTSKLLTSSMVLEENAVSSSSRFTCTGSTRVEDRKIRCWVYPEGHGTQTLEKALGNSCNPAFINLAQRVGIEKFYDYLGLFGINELTGIDCPGEGWPLIQDKSAVGIVGISNMGFGQGIAMSPIQLITAVSAIANDGFLMKPYLMKEIANEKGEVINKTEPEIVRQVMSQKTSKEVKRMMQYVIEKGGAQPAYLPGYKIGGKTGTSEVVKNGKYTGRVTASFTGIAPLEDPKFTILFVVKEPAGEQFGSTAAAPYAKAVMENTLRYMEVKPEYSKEEKKELREKTTNVPNVTGKSASDAKRILKSKGLKFIVSPEKGNTKDFKVVDQFPKSGEKVSKGSTVYIYRE